MALYQITIERGGNMAASRQSVAARQPMMSNSHGQAYVYGNVAPQKRERLPVTVHERKSKVSAQVRRNRKRAFGISPIYMAFFIVATLITVVVCVQYLHLKTELLNRSDNITALQERLSELTEENDTAYNAAVDSTNLEEVRNRAMNELGMVYPSKANVISYSSPSDDYVKQYADIPANGVLAQSEDVSN